MNDYRDYGRCVTYIWELFIGALRACTEVEHRPVYMEESCPPHSVDQLQGMAQFTDEEFTEHIVSGGMVVPDDNVNSLHLIRSLIEEVGASRHLQFQIRRNGSEGKACTT